MCVRKREKMKLDEPLRAIASALGEPNGRALPIGPGRWHVLFSGRPRPLLMPEAGYRFQKECLRYFVGNRPKALYAQALLKANTLFPGAGLLPEFRLPRSKRGASPCDLPIRRPSHAAIQIGSPGPYQKASLLMMSDHGHGLALAKLALVPTADHRVAAEADWLRVLKSIPKLADQVPGLLAEGATLNGRRYLVTTLSPSTDMTNEFTPAHLSFLNTLGRARLDTMSFAASPCLEYLERLLAELEPFMTHDALAALQTALGDCRELLSGWTGPFVMGQGDFAPWNIRVHQQRIFVFDWEYARTGANPLADVVNFFVMQRALSNREVSGRFLVTTMRGIQKIAQQLYPEWQWRPRTVSALTLVYLLEILLLYSRANQRLERNQPVIANYWRLMEERPAWIAA
jgi:phosphotransferase family enzyme